MPARLKDIAEACELNVSTVSRALRGDPRIPDVTAARVRKTAGQMGYSANPAAQALVGAKTHVVWLVLSGMGNVLEQEIAEAASRYLEQKGYDLSVVLCHGSAERYAYLLKRLRAHPVDGALIVPPFASEAAGIGREYKGLAAAGCPLVFVDRYPAIANLQFVTTNNKAGASELVDAMVHEGAEFIVVLDNPTANMVQKERCSGYAARSKALGITHVLAKSGLEPDLSKCGRIGLVASGWYPASRYAEKNRNVLSGKSVLAGVFDGWSGDRSGFDAIYVCRQDFKGMAERAVDMLLGQLEGSPLPGKRTEIDIISCEKLV